MQLHDHWAGALRPAWILSIWFTASEKPRSAARGMAHRFYDPAPSTPNGPAELGGHDHYHRFLQRLLAHKSDPPPGPNAIWIGLQRLRDLVIVRTALDEINRVRVV